jgi:hypothetical protein
MRAIHRLGAAVVLVGGLVLAMASAAPAPALSAAGRTGGGAAKAAPIEFIYVANTDAGPAVTVYRAGSRGAVAPVRTVLAPNDDNADWDPWGVTFDSSGHLYVQSFLGDATTFVFRPGAHGTTRPERDFMGDGPDNRSIAVDSHGYEYVAGSDQPTTIVVEPPGAHGSPADLYFVQPLRTFQPGEEWNPWPSDLAVDSRNELLVTEVGGGGNNVENIIQVFAGGPHGSDKALRTIAGPATGLGSCNSQFSACDQLVIAFSALTSRIYVGVTAGRHTHISVFAGNARGNARPLRTIEGPATGLAGTSITGIITSQCDGTIYAVVHNDPMGTGFGPGRIEAFGRTAHGNVRPLRVFTDRHSHFTNAQGLTITRCGGF